MTFATMLASAISLGVVFLYGCVGEIITEKAGHLNLGIPGIMCMGTAGGCLGATMYLGSVPSSAASGILVALFAVVFAFFFGALGGLIYAFLTVSLRCNQNVTGLALTTFGAGLSQFLMDKVVNSRYLKTASDFIKNLFPQTVSENFFGKVFLSHGFLIYLGIIIAIIAAIYLKKTRSGLHLRAVGENPATADAAGINVVGYKYSAILIGAGIAALGGLCYIMNYIGGSWQNSNTIQAMGWLSIALVIFIIWKPDLAIAGSILFGFFFILSSYVTVPKNVTRIIEYLPYIITVIVLIITSIFGSKSVQPPASLGVNYFREDR